MTEEEWDRVRVATAFFALSLSLSLLFLGGRSGMMGIGIRANLGGCLVLGC
jgi:hypothetical protein